ncbi:MAG: hypothetical protein E1N59_1328 [Puniceicoccaceae bacterium 5H]|nr:MAG: hypothetical protein E1N59_1328 [Puniceicoccaceae bacterium 5H]
MHEDRSAHLVNGTETATHCGAHHHGQLSIPAVEGLPSCLDIELQGGVLPPARTDDVQPASLPTLVAENLPEPPVLPLPESMVLRTAGPRAPPHVHALSVRIARVVILRC